MPLFASGVFMGLAIASKWIGCYGAVGLAVLFFSRFITLYKQSVYAKRHRDEDPAFARAAEVRLLAYGAARVGIQTAMVQVLYLLYNAILRPRLSRYGAR